MKKKYEAPTVQMEYYELDTAIASNCMIVVSNGPAVPGRYEQCSDYVDPMENMSARAVYDVDFYEDTNCHCYTTGSGNYWTS